MEGDTLAVTTKVLFVNLGEQEQLASMRAVDALRTAGISAEVYPDSAKMKKQMEYANRRGIPYVVIIGSDELAEGMATLKDMQRGEQIKVAITDLVQHIL